MRSVQDIAQVYTTPCHLEVTDLSIIPQEAEVLHQLELAHKNIRETQYSSSSNNTMDSYRRC